LTTAGPPVYIEGLGTWVVGLRCGECGRRLGLEAVATCPDCWAGLEPEYDLDAVRGSLTRDALAGRPPDLWRYRELLPVEAAGAAGATGFTPLLPAPRLGRSLGITDLWIKYEAACHPTLSFKDRLVAVALAKARQLGLPVVGCSSTGNLAGALAAGAAAAGLPAVVLVPAGLEAAKLRAAAVYGATLVGVRGDYDRANRLCAEIADRYGWGIVNVNLRAYYGEGSKTVGFEIAEQDGFALPRHVVVPMAGGSLLTKIEAAFRQLVAVGLAGDRPFSIHGTQAAGSAPIVTAFKAGLIHPDPVKPDTIVSSLAVGDPPDGAAALATMRRTGGRAEDPTDAESLDGVRRLAECEGLFAETAGGTVVAAARRLAQAGAFADGGRVVLVITGQGLKTAAVLGDAPLSVEVGGSLDEFEAFWEQREGAVTKGRA
jgi:threonine synthase